MNTLRIESCSFGSIVIGGKTYTDDLILLPESKILKPWWRRRGHELTMFDLQELLDSSPEVIVAGTGISGGMKPDQNLGKELSLLSIELIAEPNEMAIKKLNELPQQKRIGACFHLTC